MMMGTVLGNRYELIEKIGEGGMAKVYKAKDQLLNRFVAVKILKTELSNDNEFVEKFKREATAVASLSDNNIVNIYDVGSQGNINYIVMEFIDGKTLKELIIEKKRLDCNTAAKIAIEICKALDCAHRNNIIHRDIKPHNILVTNEGLVKVTDFGIAKASNSATITNSNKVMGSAHYFSPEQAKGSVVDTRTDIYSLGIVMYEMVTGRVPYDADSPVSIALKHIQEPAIPPIQLNDAIPENFNRVILKSIEKEPIKRYQDVKEMMFDLKLVLKNKEVYTTSNDSDADMTRAMDPVLINEKLNSKNKDNKALVPIPKRKNRLDNKKKRMILFVAIAVLVIAIGAVSGFFAYSKYLGGSGANVTVPTIVGLSQGDAKKAVEAVNLKFTVAQNMASDKPVGTVVQCTPTQGTKVKASSEVRVAISSGNANTTVPNVKNMDISSAKDVITNSDLKVGDITYAYSSYIPTDSVISQTPDSDSKVSSGTLINLVVSKGSEVKNVSVPDLTGKTYDQASTLLSNNKLKIAKGTDVVGTATSVVGTVAMQDIKSGISVQNGSTVTVQLYGIIYTAPDGTTPPVTTPPVTPGTAPDLTGMSLDQATAALSANKLKITQGGDKVNNVSEAAVGTVQSQKLVDASTVKVWLYGPYKAAVTPK